MTSLLKKISIIFITNSLTLIVFFALYCLAVSVSPQNSEIYKIPLIIISVFLLYQDAKILTQEI